MTGETAIGELLCKANAAGVFKVSQDQLKTLVQATTHIGSDVWPLDLSGTRNESQLLELIGKSLNFPHWYGCNRDALVDCLSDLSWSKADGYVLRVDGIETLQANDAIACQTFLEILQEISIYWQESGVAFWTLITSDIPEVPSLAEH